MPLPRRFSATIETRTQRLPVSAVFSDDKNRNARYYITDNFLKAWLSVAKPAREAARLKPIEKAIEPALRRLETLEGFAFEKLIRNIHIEMSRKGKGDFELSSLQLGFWNRPIASFLKSPQHKRLEGWTIEKPLFSPQIANNSRTALSAKGYICKDLTDYAGLV